MNLEVVRYCERSSLLPKSPRSASGYRLFPIDATQRLRFIRRAKETGFLSQKDRGIVIAAIVTKDNECRHTGKG
jgi:DNA-binding transcriptional MerR regulator